MGKKEKKKKKGKSDLGPEDVKVFTAEKVNMFPTRV